MLYSGGLDSSILAKILLSVFSPSSISTVSVGLMDSYDFKNSIIGAKELGINLYTHLITSERVLRTIQSLKRLNIIQNVNDLSIAIPLFLGMQNLAERFKVKTVFLGQGADELFGGYQKYVTLYRNSGSEHTQKAMAADLKKLKEHQIILEKKLADHFNQKLVYPFLDPEIINVAQSLPITSHIVQTSQGNLIRKAIIRRMAKNLSLTQRMVNQPKKAMQYGSGTVKTLRKLAKSSGYRNTHDWFQEYFKSKTKTGSTV